LPQFLQLIFTCFCLDGVLLEFEILQRTVAFKKPVEDGHSCAFELLASLAGELLKESESSTSSNASDVKPLTEERFRNGSCEEKNSEKHLESAGTDCILECISANNNVKSEIFKLENRFGNHSNTNRLVEVSNHHEADSSGFKRLSAVHSPSLANLSGNIKSPFCGELFPNASFSRNGRNASKLGFIDDDENFIRCNKVCTKPKAFRPSRYIARKIIRKRWTSNSKHWKVAPKLKDCEHSRYGKVFSKLSAMSCFVIFHIYVYELGCSFFGLNLNAVPQVLFLPFLSPRQLFFAPF
jgi:hypothetical protein